jgi:hypothetical protein
MISRSVVDSRLYVFIMQQSTSPGILLRQILESKKRKSMRFGSSYLILAAISRMALLGSITPSIFNFT